MVSEVPKDPAAAQRRIRQRRFAWQLPLFLAVWCLFLELFVRLVLTSPSSAVDDAQLGWEYRPSSTSLQMTNDAGSRVESFNAFGLNDDPIDLRSRQSRIIVLGDSYVEALQVPRRKNFMHIIERDMPGIRLINAGRSALDPVSELVVLDRLAGRIAPAAVIDVVNGDDEQDMLLYDDIKVRHCGRIRVVCDYRLPAVGPDRLRTLLGPVMERSALITYLLRKYKDTVSDELADIRNGIARYLPPGHARPASASPSGWAAPVPSDIEGLLQIVFARMKGHGRLIVVFVPQLEYLPGNQSRVADSRTFISTVARAAHNTGSGFLDASVALAAAYAKSGQPSNGFDFTIMGQGHLNPQGHRALAKALEPQLTGFVDRR